MESSGFAGWSARHLPWGLNALRRICAAEMHDLPGTIHGADASPREVLPMSEVLPFPPKPPPKSIEEETAEFLALLERIRSQSQRSK